MGFSVKSIIILIALIIVTVSSHADELIDPTRPFGGSVTKVNNQQGPLKLNTIIFANGQGSAIINGQRLKAGDQLGEYRVITIDKKYVILSKEDERIQLDIFSQQVVQTNE